MCRVSLTAILVLFAAPFALADDKEEQANEERALLRRDVLLKACKAYALYPLNEGNKYPVTLMELVKPAFGGGSILANGEKALLDPWGKPFQYALVPGEKGKSEPYVWTERTVDGKTRVIGTKPPAPKKP